MKKLLLSATLLLSINSFAVISEVSDVTLQLKEVTLTIDTTTVKSLVSATECVPSWSAWSEAANYVNEHKNAVKVVDIIDLNSKEAASCPEQFKLQTVVRYYSK